MLGVLLFAFLAVVMLFLTVRYLEHPTAGRPHDFLQVWSAGKLAMTGENPYDAKRMLDLQSANDSPRDFASMMWVPPWGIAVAMPIGALPVAYAQGVWVFGQAGLILLSGLILWRLYGGRSDRWWIAVLLVLASGPVWWQTVNGQYAGVLLFGIVGYLAAHRANRPMVAGFSLALAALKPHLFVFFGIGLIIDALRSGFGRRVLLGGAIGLMTGSIAATIASPAIWGQYIRAIAGGGSQYAPGLGYWFSPTIPAWIRFSTPGQAFWIQVVPCAIAAVGFAAYWWRTGSPDRWPVAINWVIPACLMLAPYGSWPSDLSLMLVPIVGIVARIDSRGWALSGRVKLATFYLATNLYVMVMFYLFNKSEPYIFIAPAFCLCLLWARKGLKQSPAIESVESGSEQCNLQPQPSAG
jgi:hypothetical protein